MDWQKFAEPQGLLTLQTARNIFSLFQTSFLNKNPGKFKGTTQKQKLMVELNPPKGYDEQSRSHLKNMIGSVSTVVSNSFWALRFRSDE